MPPYQFSMRTKIRILVISEKTPQWIMGGNPYGNKQNIQTPQSTKKWGRLTNCYLPPVSSLSIFFYIMIAVYNHPRTLLFTIFTYLGILPTHQSKGSRFHSFSHHG